MEMAPWAKKPSQATPNIKWHTKTNIRALTHRMAERAVGCQPHEAVTEMRLDRLDDAWRTMSCEAGERQACDCVRCITIDILQITHVISKREFLEAITQVAGYVNSLEGSWAIGTLAPGKSNFWLSGMLLCDAMLSSEPSAVILTSVNDSKPWLVQPVNVYARNDAVPEHIIVLDDMSYSGTQLCNLLGNLTKAFPSALVHACPLFLTPHAKVKVEQTILSLNACLAPCHQVTPDNNSMFAELGLHRHSKAKSFSELMQLYAFGKAWGDARALSENKTLTTCLPYYKIPDYYSCPEAAYLSKVIRHNHEDVPEETLIAIERYRFKDTDQKPSYKNLKL